MLHLEIFRKGFKYMGYKTVFYGDYNKVIKRLMYFCPPTKCFYEDVLSNMLQTILSELLRQSF